MKEGTESRFLISITGIEEGELFSGDGPRRDELLPIDLTEQHPDDDENHGEPKGWGDGFF